MNDKSYSLSDKDIYKINPNLKLILYEDVSQYKNIDDLLYPFDSVIILYEWERTKDASIGHYVAVNRLKDGSIEHFDSYSIKPDEELKQLKNASDSYKRMTKQDQQYLLKLYIKSPYVISYNHYPFQSLDKDVSTCGRYCVLRCLLRMLTLEEFAKFITSNGNTDDFVTLLTSL
jgi:hypothetical protein